MSFFQLKGLLIAEFLMFFPLFGLLISLCHQILPYPVAQIFSLLDGTSAFLVVLVFLVFDILVVALHLHEIIGDGFHLVLLLENYFFWIHLFPSFATWSGLNWASQFSVAALGVATNFFLSIRLASFRSWKKTGL